MLAIQIQRTGGPEVLEAVDLPAPIPGPGQILIRHKAIGLNYIDTYHRTGLYPVKLPAVLGQEAAGLVEAVGEGVTRFKAGDRVAYGSGPMGAYSELHVVPADRAVKVPDGISLEIAAAIMLKGMTAEFLIRRCHPILSGEWILVHAAAGGVGSILTQWAHALGTRVIGTVGSAAKAKIAKAQGCEEVILYGEEDVAARVKEITHGKGASAVYDGVGAATFEASLNSLARRGILVSYGNASGPAPAVEPGRLARGGSLYLTRPTLFDYIATHAELESSASAVFEAVSSGSIKIEIGQTFALAEARKAHEALEGRATTGSTLLLP
ncbi:MAG: quinone oxidoreductase [Caulobacteraceae bacterium]|nr:quinone oxidoreductase [Caulobacteraceae bacterium]